MTVARYLQYGRQSMAGLSLAADRWRFGPRRGDYYDYLSALMQAMQGRRTLKEIFEYDARRYGADSVRGRLSLRWADAYQATGGDLYATWLGSFPVTELSLIRAAQSFGNESLTQTLRDLADTLQLMQQARRILTSTLWSAAIALSLLLLMVLAIPSFTLPRLLHTFYMVPAHYYGGLTRALIEFSGFIRVHWLFILVLISGAGGVFFWSLPNLSGPIRQHLEKYTLWRIYRGVHALHFLATLSITLARQGAVSTQLRMALWMQKNGASKWQSWHIDAMLARIDAGRADADTFDTGLLDRDLFWFLSDMVMAHGLAKGLYLARLRLKRQVLEIVSRQALILRWFLLLFSVSSLLGLGLWHYAVIDELRRSLMLFYASQ